MSDATAGQTGERIALLKVLGPIHVWALGVGSFGATSAVVAAGAGA